jgi:hypothetical protein
MATGVGANCERFDASRQAQATALRPSWAKKLFFSFLQFESQTFPRLFCEDLFSLVIVCCSEKKIKL